MHLEYSIPIPTDVKIATLKALNSEPPPRAALADERQFILDSMKLIQKLNVMDEFSPDFCKNTILRYELAMMARTCTNNLRVVFSPYVQHCPREASEQKWGQKTNI